MKVADLSVVEGFVDFICVKDIPVQGSNKTGAVIYMDKEVFADIEVADIISSSHRMMATDKAVVSHAVLMLLSYLLPISV